jgi:hypothetical protein
MPGLPSIAAHVLAAAAASQALAGVTILTQQRTISVATTLDANITSASAPDFSPFVRKIQVGGVVQGAGGLVPVTASGRIDCQIDPNKIIATGRILGAGAVAASTNTIEEGNSKVLVLVTFMVDAPIQIGLVAAPSPAVLPTDDFIVELRDQTRHNDVFSLQAHDPPQTVNFTTTLQPGEYSMKYKIEGTFSDAQIERSFGFALAFPRPAPSDCNNNGIDDYVELVLGAAPDVNHNGIIDACECLADWNGGGLSIADVFAFINDWFIGTADFNHSGDITTDDIFDFLNAWFAGC